MRGVAKHLGLSDDEREGSLLVAWALAFVTYLLGAVVVFGGGGLGIDLAVGPLAIMIGLATFGEARLALKPTRARRLVADRFVYIAVGYALFLGVASTMVLLIGEARS